MENLPEGKCFPEKYLISTHKVFLKTTAKLKSNIFAMRLHPDIIIIELTCFLHFTPHSLVFAEDSDVIYLGDNSPWDTVSN
jgi:hypothetical protein